MKIDDMTFDSIKTLALHYPVKMPQKNGPTPIKDGKFLAYAAKAEEIRRYYRAAKHDLRDRELRGGSYQGDHGHVTIGGHSFTLYRTTPATLIRDDFARWIEANWQKHLHEDGSERLPEHPTRVDDVQKMPIGNYALQARLRAKELTEPTELLPDDAWNTQYEMECQLHRYHAEIERDSAEGRSYIVTKLQGVLLAAMAQHRRGNYADAIDNFINVAACAIRAAEYEAKMHSKGGDGK